MDLPAYRLFILGAGFSRPAGFPLGAELLNLVRQRVRAIFKQSDWDGPLEQEIEEWQALYPTAPVTLESVLAYSHRKHFLGLIGSEEYFAHGSRSIVEARRAIQEILTELSPSTIDPLYAQFANALGPNDTVLTFNYDTLLEQSLDAVSKPFSLTPEWWLAEDPTDTERAVTVSEYVNVIKLHGSIDWYDRHYYDEDRRYFSAQAHPVPDRDPLFGPAARIPVEPLAKRAVRGSYGGPLLSRVFRVPDHRSLFPFAHSWEVVPFLLPPAHDKLLGHDPIRGLWQNMHRTNDAYSVIAVVGYSMPPYDAYAYEALGHLLINYQARGEQTWFGHRRVPLQIVTSAASKADVLRNIPFLRDDKTLIWHRGFSRQSLEWLDWG